MRRRTAERVAPGERGWKMMNRDEWRYEMERKGALSRCHLGAGDGRDLIESGTDLLPREK